MQKHLYFTTTDFISYRRLLSTNIVQITGSASLDFVPTGVQQFSSPSNANLKI